MKLTNKLGFPEAVVQAVAYDDYDKGDADYSVTGLMEPARKSTLIQRHGNSLTEDVADRIYAFIGKIGHAVFERAKVTGDVVEHRVSMSIDGFKISGKFDRLVKGDLLIDLKLMSVWEIIFGLKEERIWQLNMYRYMAAQNGIRVDQMAVIGILRDWSIGEAERRAQRGDTNYPQKQVIQIPIPIYSDNLVLNFIKDRIKAHERARNTPNWLPECTADERWEKPTTYALMKEGRKSALRVMDDEQALMRWAVENSFADWPAGSLWTPRKGVKIDVRLGESTRCQRYCNALEVCTQGQKLVAAVAAGTTEAA